MQYSEIKSIDQYNKRMAESILDKAFFIDKIDCDVIVDFGCANGDMLSFISFVSNHKTLVGYDIDPHMILLAEEKLSQGETPYYLFSFWDEMVETLIHLKDRGDKICLVLSSVLHEVYHYSTPTDIDLFWEKIWSESFFDNIVIRDMIPSFSMERSSDINHVANIFRNKEYSMLLEDFQKHHGSIHSNKNLIHFLMKYKYKEPNWEREVKENYFPIYYESLLALLSENYEIIYNNQYKLPHIWRNVKKDFGINMRDNTHLQLILEKK